VKWHLILNWSVSEQQIQQHFLLYVNINGQIVIALVKGLVGGLNWEPKQYAAFVPKHSQYVPHINTVTAVPEITVAR
jgi:hypothetical protein